LIIPNHLTLTYNFPINLLIHINQANTLGNSSKIVKLEKVVGDQTRNTS